MFPSYAREDGIHEAITRYSSMVYRLAFARTRNHADAEDIYQEVFLKLAKEAPTFESEAHRKAWLLRVTSNCSINLLKSAWRRYVQTSDTPTEPARTRAEAPSGALRRALDRLPAKYRAVVHLYYYEGMPTDEIADMLGRKPATVRSQLARAREKLKNEMLRTEEANPNV